MRTLRGRKAESFVRKLEQRGAADLARVEKTVARIVADVRRNGDKALRRYAEKLDGLKSKQPLCVSEAELEQAWSSVSEEFRQALKVAAGNIRQYCEWQKPQQWRNAITPGINVGQVVRPLQSVGCYVPGGRYPLPSTMLMTVIPAQVAGVNISALSLLDLRRKLWLPRIFSACASFIESGSASHRRIGVWNSNDPESRQDCWSRESFCDRRKKTCRF